MTDTIRSIAYIRQSERRGGEDERTSLSLRGQEDLYRRWCQQRGAIDVGIVRDHDLRGADPDRPGLRELIETLQTQRVDVVWLFSLSRLARQLSLQLIICRDIEHLGVQLFSETEGGIDDPFIRGLLGLMHEQSTRQQSAHLKSAHARRARDGGFPVGSAPIGYRRPNHLVVHRANDTTSERETGTPEIDPDGAEVVRRIFIDFVGGQSFMRIARELNRGGPGVRGGHWRHRQLHKILTNPIYCGDVQHLGKVVAHNPDWAIVDRATWDQAQARLASFPKTRTRIDRPRPWFDGLIQHACGRRMSIQYSRHAQQQYRCNGRGDNSCTHDRPNCRADWIEPAIREAIRRDLGNRRTVAQALQWAQDLAGGRTVRDQVRDLDRRERAAHERWTRNHERFSEGKLRPAVMDAEDERLEHELATIALERAAVPVMPSKADIEHLEQNLASVRDLLDHGSPDALRALLEGLGFAVLDEQGITIQYRPELLPLLTSTTVPIPRALRWTHPRS